MLRVILAGLGLLLSFTLSAEEANKPQSPWKGEAELGWISTSGNTDTDSLNIKLGLSYKKARWLHKLSVSVLRATDQGTTTANQRSAKYRSRYDLRQYDYAFGSLHYEKDPFAGFNRRTTEIIGYGRDVIKTDELVLDLEGGIGARQTQRTDATDESEGIIRLAADLRWEISKTSRFSQELSAEHGDKNTVTQSVTALKLKINSRLAMKTSYNITHNSDVPVGTKKQDTHTAVTLVYDF